MKIPCEIIVWYVLPIIRREFANELVVGYGMSQAEVARRFGVTDAAISQYLKKKRGDSSAIEHMDTFPLLLDEIKESARRVVEEDADFDLELCRLCGAVKTTGLLGEISSYLTGHELVECYSMGGPFSFTE